MSIHFGVDYYPEHWPRERWETDAQLMKEMGIQVVRKWSRRKAYFVFSGLRKQ